MWGDVLGGTASVICAVHCLALPFVAGLAPALAGEGAELATTVGLVVFSGAIVARGWWRHRRLAPLLVYAFGAGLLIGARLGEHLIHDWEHVVVVVVAVALVGAHVLNASCARQCCSGVGDDQIADHRSDREAAEQARHDEPDRREDRQHV